MNKNNENVIERPYMNEYCDKCLYRFNGDTPEDDMCRAIRMYGQYYTECARVVTCDRFKEKIN